MLSTRAPAQVAQSVEQWTEKAFPTPQSALPLSATVIARFWSHVDQSGGPNTCHPWTGALDKDGYGVWSPERGVRSGVHRTALELKIGRRLAAGEEARHVNGCRSRACCNQLHLEPGTHQQNIADREAAGTTQKGERHYKARLTVESVIEARRRAGNETYAAIARDMGVSPKCIAHAVRGDNWKHVTAGALARGEVTVRKARALFGVTRLLGGAS